MATISITVPDSALPRLRAAFGHPDPVTPGAWVDATNAEVMAAVKAALKSKVIDHETTIAAMADRATRSSESW